MLSLSAVRSQSSQLLARIKMLQMQRKSRIQSRLCEYCQMRELRWPTHGWLTRVPREDFLSPREETATQEEKNRENNQ